MKTMLDDSAKFPGDGFFLGVKRAECAKETGLAIVAVNRSYDPKADCLLCTFLTNSTKYKNRVSHKSSPNTIKE